MNSNERKLQSAVIFCAFLFPFELLISIARHKLALAIGPVGLLFHPAVPFAVACLSRGRFMANRALLLALGTYAAGLIISGLVTGSQPFHVISVVALGPVLMAVIIATLDDEDDLLDRVIAAFVAGVAVWASIFVLWFAITAAKIISIQPELLTGPSLGKVFLWLRLPGALASEFYFFKLLGNYNKQSNIIVLSLILSGYLYVKGRWTCREWAISTTPMLLILLVMFSRGGFAVLALVVAGLAITALLRRARWRQFAVAATMACAVLASASLPELRGYWRNFGSLEERATIMAGSVAGDNHAYSATGEVRNDPSRPLSPHFDPSTPEKSTAETQSSGKKPSDDDRCEAKPPEPSMVFHLFGYGLGHFGPTICRLPEAESHNAFQDAWIQGGILGFVGYSSIFIVGTLAGARRLIKTRLADTSALFGLAIVLAVMALAQREFAFVYLWVQSAGGVLLAIGLLLVSQSQTMMSAPKLVASLFHARHR